MAGSVVTFYSYKGGVGRSFALANIAVILAEWGARVLVVDWDIEAPGLDHYFGPYLKTAPAAGVLDFLADCQGNTPRSWDAYATRIDLPDEKRGLHFMPASGGSGIDYTRLLQDLDWDELYREHALGARLEELRAAWVDAFDVVLVDSRTGITDFSGLSTVQLPDILAFLFTANRQSLEGCVDVTRRAMAARQGLAVDRPALLPLPIPARFEQREEYDRAQAWRKRFAHDLEPFFQIWAPPDSDPLKLVDLLTIPYVPRWTFGEEIAALLEPAGPYGIRSPSQTASYACETLAALLLQRFARMDLLLSSRDEYIHTARSLLRNRYTQAGGRVRVFISYSARDAVTRDLLPRVAGALERGGLCQVVTDHKIMPGDSTFSFFREAVELADMFIIIVGPATGYSQRQMDEIRYILSVSLRRDRSIRIVPLIIKGCEEKFYNSLLANFHALIIDPRQDIESQLDPLISLLKR